MPLLRSLGGLLLFAIATAIASAPLRAQTGKGSAPAANSAGDSTEQQRELRRPRWGTDAWLPRLRLDNDAYNFWIHPGHRTDEEYSNGVVASLETLRAPWWGQWFGGARPGCGQDTSATGACLTTEISLGQRLYTPNLSRPPFSSPEWERERPYAAWLYVGGAGRIVSPRRVRQIEAAVGVTGRPALGETAQSIAHLIVRKYTAEAHGWETQVGFQPGLQLGWRESFLAARVATGTRGWLDLAPTLGVQVGTIRTAADAGARLRAGYNLSHPWDPRAWRGRSPLEFFASAGGRVEYVAREFSLDGTLVNTERRVTRVPEVREFDVGIGLRMHRLRLDWGATTRSREYTTGPRRHVFGTMAATWEFVP